MALTTINELNDVFSGLSSIYLKKGGFSGDISALAFDWQLPVTVDSLSFSQAEPTLNRTKVHGLQADWAVTATPGDVTFTATVPTMSEEVTTWFLGGPTKTVTSAALNESTSNKFSGNAYALKQVKLYASIGLLSEDGNKLFVIKRLALYATPVFENGSTTPYAFRLTGSIEAVDSASQDDILFLDKDA
jgi:hypothetical protein